jgi:hypothetical protein
MLIFGLGTTGARYVDNIALALKKFNPNGELPANQCLIAMDTHYMELMNLGNLPEYDKISLDKPTDVVIHQFDRDLPNDFVVVGDGGAGLNRRLGLAYYRYNREKIRAHVMSIATNIIRQNIANNFQVILISSLFGGTGSGCLIDFALDLKEWISQLPGVMKFSCMTIGVLPHMNSSDAAKANAYATLKEVSFIRA